MTPTITTPVYRESAAHARKFGELDRFRESHWANIDCKKDIEKADGRLKAAFEELRPAPKKNDSVNK